MNKETGESEVKDIDNYKVKCFVKNQGEEEVLDSSGNNEIFVSLTPAQVTSMNNKINSGVEINQHLWTAYEYEKDGETFIGVGLVKERKPAKSFADFN